MSHILSASNPAVRCFNTTNITLTTGVTTALTFNTVRYDQGSPPRQHDTVNSPSRLTCQMTGVYSIAGTVVFAANGTGIRNLFIQLNGTTPLASCLVNAVSTGGNATNVVVMTHYLLVANDYVELMATQTSGGNLDIVAAGNYSPEFGFVKIG